MQWNRVCAVFFSGTGTTKAIVLAIAKELAKDLKTEYEAIDISLVDDRKEPLVFGEKDIVVFGTPVYAGRVPNVLLKFLSTIEGNGASAVPVVVFGNRAFDDALIELRDILMVQGLKAVAAGAFVGEHSFTRVLAPNRPDAKDFAEAETFAGKVAQKIRENRKLDLPVAVPGNAGEDRIYYMPKDDDDNLIDLRRVAPSVTEDCIRCGRCAAICRMGSIDSEDPRKMNGICIRCSACVKECPAHARVFDHPEYVFHAKQLEELYSRRADNAYFL